MFSRRPGFPKSISEEDAILMQETVQFLTQKELGEFNEAMEAYQKLFDSPAFIRKLDPSYQEKIDKAEAELNSAKENLSAATLRAVICMGSPAEA
jgi:hypothetical protein